MNSSNEDEILRKQMGPWSLALRPESHSEPRRAALEGHFLPPSTSTLKHKTQTKRQTKGNFSSEISSPIG